MLIRGNTLNPVQRRQVLAAFVHRWTHENARQTYGGKCPGCQQRHRSDPVTINGVPWHDYHRPLQTDVEWLNEYAFYFVADGSRLSAKHGHCEPAYLKEGTT